MMIGIARAQLFAIYCKLASPPAGAEPTVVIIAVGLVALVADLYAVNLSIVGLNSYARA